jgi:phosphoribosyl 1,2-cyclic phosphate phosphodiesterase
MKVTILGCGGSGGIPVADGSPGGYWGACDPSEPRNRRRRVSILVQHGDATFLVDTSPDLRVQLLDAGVERLDAVFFTHGHADHSHGIDELRGLVYRRGAPLPAYMDAAARADLTERFPYAFASSRDPESFYPPLMTDVMINGGATIHGVEVTAFVQGHGAETTLGYRFGPVAYSTDVDSLDEPAFAALAGVKVWIVDCLREAPHPTHSHLAQTLDWIARVAPERAVLTHMNHQTDYAALRALCPPGVEPAYDGMVIEV